MRVREYVRKGGGVANAGMGLQSGNEAMRGWFGEEVSRCAGRGRLQCNW